MTKGIIFDCFGVLIESSEAELKRLCPTEKLLELHDLRLQRDRGIILYAQYLESLSELLSISLDQVRGITESLHVRNHDLFDFVEHVDRSSYKIGLLSNIGDQTMEQLFTADEIERLFDATVLSYQVGVVKPEPEIYHIMATRLDLTPEECVFVDDVEQNCIAAERQGMQSILHVDNTATLNALARLTK